MVAAGAVAGWGGIGRVICLVGSEVETARLEAQKADGSDGTGRLESVGGSNWLLELPRVAFGPQNTKYFYW